MISLSPAHESFRQRSRAGTRVYRIASFPPVIPQNPYQRLLYEQLAAEGLELAQYARFKLDWLYGMRGRVQALHFHWPEGYYQHRRGPEPVSIVLSCVRTALFVARLLTARALGYRVVWTIHQLYPHETSSRRLDHIASLALGRLSAVCIAHDRATSERATRELGVPEERIAVIPHGSYVGVYPDGQDRRAVRAQLDISEDALVFLSFGHVRGYKDLGFLCRAFRETPLESAVLLVAGLPLDDLVLEELRVAAQSDPRVKVLPEFVPDSRVAELFSASDAVVLPRGDGGTSGALILALSLGKPVVAAKTRSNEEVLGPDVGWLFEPHDVRALRQALLSVAAERDRLPARGRAGLERARSLAWPDIGRRTAAAIRGRRTPNAGLSSSRLAR